MDEQNARPRVFLSYSHEDRQWVDRLAIHLRAIGGLDVWTDSSIQVGDSWARSINEAISTTDVAVLLVSADYLASGFIDSTELPALLDAAERGDTLIIPIFVSYVHVPRGHPLSKWQWVGRPDEPLSALERPQQEALFLQVAQVIQRWLVEERIPISAESTSRLRVVDESEQDDSVVEVRTSSVAADQASLVDAVAKTVMGMLVAGGQGNSSGESQVPRKRARESDLVFVIMPFTDDMEPIFEGVEEAAKAAGLTAKRVKDVPGDYRITDKIMDMILSSRLVVADLSHERPNVYFELGYARGIGKTVITTARTGTTIHFDVKDWTYIPYGDSRTLQRDLEERFRNELER